MKFNENENWNFWNFLKILINILWKFWNLYNKILIDCVFGNSKFVVPSTLTIDLGFASVNSRCLWDNKLMVTTSLMKILNFFEIFDIFKILWTLRKQINFRILKFLENFEIFGALGLHRLLTKTEIF
jgi:hypothetical protein